MNAAYTCSDGTGGSGIPASGGCVGPVANGTPIDTTVGSHTFLVTATDAAGNTATALTMYSVGYKVCLLYNPTTKQPGNFNLTLQLCNASGANLSSASIVLKAVYLDSPGTAPPVNHRTGATDSVNFTFSGGSVLVQHRQGPPAEGQVGRAHAVLHREQCGEPGIRGTIYAEVAQSRVWVSESPAKTT